MSAVLPLSELLGKRKQFYRSYSIVLLSRKELKSVCISSLILCSTKSKKIWGMFIFYQTISNSVLYPHIINGESLFSLVHCVK